MKRTHQTTYTMLKYSVCRHQNCSRSLSGCKLNLRYVRPNMRFFQRAAAASRGYFGAFGGALVCAGSECKSFNSDVINVSAVTPRTREEVLTCRTRRATDMRVPSHLQIVRRRPRWPQSQQQSSAVAMPAARHLSGTLLGCVVMDCCRCGSRPAPAASLQTAPNPPPP